MNIPRTHNWHMSPKEAVSLQKKLTGKYISKKLSRSKIKLLAGIDVSVKNDHSNAAVVIMTFPELKVIETVTAKQRTCFPYVPGLLSFREAPVILKCLKKLDTIPDLLIFDGQGRTHPRRTGIATHMGILLNLPSIGSAKSHLYGTFSLPGPDRGSYSIIKDKDGTNLGAVLRTRTNMKPIFVSPGHLIDISSCVNIIMTCSPKYKLPEPIRAAHNAARF